MNESDEALSELAANRGCKLVKSRLRTPGKGDYGRFGLKDSKSGREIFGFGKKGLTATPEEIAAFLRGNAAATWKSSVGTAKSAPRPKAEPKPRPEPKLVLRDAKPGDAEALAALIAALGYEVTAAEVRKRLRSVEALVADKGGIVGILSISVMNVLHRPKPVGRISMMVVAEAERGRGIGAALVAEAERRLGARGCGLVEVTSNQKRLRAHAFYEKLGYERTSYRFFKPL
ncbi:MAG: GNAT family N-acetyltransferase [Alphaproteobacteria bacterium]|nr:MAG: GNAT family N-acetyltransferase [Alphaproteobacteria bacterium]